MSARLAATRMNLVRGRRRMEQMRRGTALLRRKREALASELFKLARPAADARTVIAERAREAWAAALPALERHGESGLSAMAWPLREIQLSIEPGQVWGIPISHIVDRVPARRSAAARGTAAALTGPATEHAARLFEALADLLLEAAPQELLLRRLGDALAGTSRQVNRLEQRLAPRLARRLVEIRRSLEEREREDRLRLRHLATRRAP